MKSGDEIEGGKLEAKAEELNEKARWALSYRKHTRENGTNCVPTWPRRSDLAPDFPRKE